MEIHPVKQIKLYKLLDEMLAIDKELYERILDTPGFSYCLNQICKLAQTGDLWYDAADEPFKKEPRPESQGGT